MFFCFVFLSSERLQKITCVAAYLVHGVQARCHVFKSLFEKRVRKEHPVRKQYSMSGIRPRWDRVLRIPGFSRSLPGDGPVVVRLDDDSPHTCHRLE